MILEYEPASEPPHLSARQLTSAALVQFADFSQDFVLVPCYKFVNFGSVN